MMKELKENFVNEMKITLEKREEIDSKLEKNEEKIKKIQDQQDKLNKERANIELPGWIETILIPLAKELASRYELEYEIYGPFGMNARTTIYLMEDKSVGIVNQKTKSITIQPKSLKINVELVYEAGKRKEAINYASNSIPALNGDDMEVQPLPETIEEIMGIMDRDKVEV
ncbi:hypothetical protein MZM54_03520 [[Brevibacterium] frigoritolerans]|nr:hypothetical protein [Peribacillus frigoritolerans]